MKNRVCDMLGMEFPLFAFTHCRDVVVAVSKAGGFGVFGASSIPPEQLEIELSWIDEHIDGMPYGVDLIVPNKMVGREEKLSKGAMVDMVPETHRKFTRDILESYDIDASSLTDEKLQGGTTLGTNLRLSGAQDLLDVAFSHPIKLIANALGETVACVMDGQLSGMTALHTWVGIVAFTFQLYFDFSGYSDMAIGLGRMAGIEFLENFRMPYIATNFTDFWRRWHISLSSFMREYLYVPLGGNRVSKAKAYRNLWIVFLISGLWHGAAWPFIAWGAFHGFFLTLDRLFWLRVSQKLPKLITLPLTFFFVLIGWVLFRSETMSDASSYLLRMFCLTAATSPPPVWADVISHRGAAMMGMAALFSFAPAIPWVRRVIEATWESRVPRVQVMRSLVAILLLLLSACSLANASFNPFIYFRF